MPDNTVFDSVFKTMVHKIPKLLIPFINETFGRDYPNDAKIVRFCDEHEGPRGTIIDDTVFKLHDKIYHIECQSTEDYRMVVRMIEYDFSIALESALSAGKPYEMDFPASCVLFLRHTSNTPDVLSMRVNLPDGESFDYKVKVVKAQNYSSVDLFNKQLLLLVPFYLMRYENALNTIASDDMQTAQLISECAEMRANLESMAVEMGDALLYDELTELIIKVSDHVLSAHEALRKRVRKAMGGEVLELLHDRAERLEREGEARGLAKGLEQGREQGLEQGLEQGREQGIAQGYDELANALKSRGLDSEMIDEVVRSLKAPKD